MRIFSEEKIFKVAMVLSLGLMASYFAFLVGSLATYTNFKAFTQTLISSEILFSIKLSLITATVASILALLIAVPSAYALSRFNFPGKNILDALLDLPIFISPIAIGAMILVFFNTTAGETVERMHPFVFEVSGIILAQFTIVSALALRLMKSTFDGIDVRYEDVSRTLGCSKTMAFFKVTLPMAKSGLIAAAIITWARAVGEFGATITLAGATAMKTETLPVAIHLGFATADIQKAVAVIMVLILIATFSLVLLRQISYRINLQ